MTAEKGSLEAARAAKTKARKLFQSYGQVVGVGITRVEGEYALKVNLESEPKDDRPLPETVDGVRVVVDVVGRIRKQEESR